ncbi:MAG: DUF302 domain-containing protein [Coriobacteriia bacterium]|nr:DUF302 domain-containing protein [Coriobacteriia bacterium]
MQIDFTRPTDKSFAEAVQAVVDAAALHSFRVSFVHDVAKTLQERGFEREPLTIVEMCNAKFASEVLAEDVLIGLMLPCPVMVYEQDGDVLISTMRPTVIDAFFPEAEITHVAREVEAKIFAIVEEAAGVPGAA